MAFKLLVGGYANVITALSFNPSSTTGALSFVAQSQVGPSPSWIAFHPTNSSILYAVNEQSTGLLKSFVLNKTSGILVPKSSVTSGGADPAHFAPLKNGKEVYVTNVSHSVIPESW